jgi:uncharacterized protein (TIGR03083 family)
MTTAEKSHVDVAHVVPIAPGDGMPLFAAEIQRNLALMRSLSADDWTKQTECPDWDVRRMYLHVLGACESGASIRELAHQMLAARAFQRKHGGPQETALSAVQVAERLELTPEQLVARLSSIAPVTVRKRTRLPSLVRRARIGVDGPVVEKWSMGYLIDVIYLRDAWMHRIDVARATGSPLVLSADHDGRIIADVVAEWARRHGQPFTLTLGGPAGGPFTGRGGADVPITLDAVEFCRILAGRSQGSGLLATIVPF